MNWRPTLKLVAVSVSFAALVSSPEARALTLDWSGYFRASNENIFDYQMNRSEPGYSNMGNSGEDIPGNGSKNATFSTMFMKLKPKVLVNDNVIIHSEWNLGDPVYGFFGRGVPQSDRNNPLSTGKDPMSLSVSRLWLDVHSDFGTIQVGRAPMQWGLGVIFNSGDNPFDRYQSTSDTIRLISKFGYLSLMPLYAKNAMGSNLSGSSNPLGSGTSAILAGDDDVTDYGIGLRYDNPEEDLDAGVLYYNRSASDQQTNYYYPSTASTYTAGANGMTVRLFDIYAKKTWHRFELGAEVPLYSGAIGDVNGIGSRNQYKATAVAVEASLKYDTWRHTLKLGTVPGQSPAATGAHGDTFSAMQFHRAYKLGLLLFNYNFHNFGVVNPDLVPNSTPANGYNRPTVASPYDAAISNAKYVMLSTEKHWEQWGMNFGAVWARANQVAVSGQDAYNHETHQWFTSLANQSANMGIEFDYGIRYNWDDNVSFGADFGVLFPGAYFQYINNPTQTSPANSVAGIVLTGATVF